MTPSARLPFRPSLTTFRHAVGSEVARQVESQFAAAASVALLCLKEYVGEQYSDQLFSAFERSVQADTQQVNLAADSPVITSAVEQHGLAIAGVGTILVTQLVYRLAQKLTRKDCRTGGRQGGWPRAGQGRLVVHPCGGLDRRRGPDRL